MLDKDAKKAYQREYMANRRKKDAQDGSGSTNPVRPIPQQPLNVRPIVLDPPNVRPDMLDLVDCNCLHCQTNRANGSRHSINHGPWKSAGELAANEINRVPLPGDVDYAGCV